MTEILRLDPTNMFLKLEVIKKHFESENVWLGYTEYMRFEALVDLKISKEPNSEESLKMRSELEQLRYMIQINKNKLNEKGIYNQFRITGSNINGTLGIGSEDESSEKVHFLTQFNNRKLYEIVVADFHTLVLASGCNCVDPFRDHCKG